MKGVENLNFIVTGFFLCASPFQGVCGFRQVGGLYKIYRMADMFMYKYLPLYEPPPTPNTIPYFTNCVWLWFFGAYETRTMSSDEVEQRGIFRKP